MPAVASLVAWSAVHLLHSHFSRHMQTLSKMHRRRALVPAGKDTAASRRSSLCVSCATHQIQLTPLCRQT